MKIDLYNRYAQISSGSIIQVRELTKYRPANYMHSRAYIEGNWDGYNHIVTPSGRFSTGHLELITTKLSDKEIEYEVKDYRQIPFEKIVRIVERGEDVGLYPHQSEALNNCYKEVAGVIFPQGIFDLATNAGKTLIITRLLSVSGLRAVVLIHKEQLLKDLVKSLSEVGLSVGVLTSATASLHEHHDVVVGMYKTALNRSKNAEFKFWIETAEAVIVDECHRAGGADYQKLLSMFRAGIRWGFSGSPFDNENAMKILGYFGDTLISKNNEELIDSGVSANVEVHMAKIPYPRAMDYEDAFEMMKFFPTRNNYFKSFLVKGEKFIWCVEHHDHADHVLKLIEKEFDVCLYDGRTKKQHSQIIKQFNEGILDGIVVNASGMEGLNLTNLKTVVYARGGKSLVWLKQFLGRGLRKKSDGSNNFKFIDCFDDNRYLKSSSVIRMQYYLSQNFTIIE